MGQYDNEVDDYVSQSVTRYDDVEFTGATGTSREFGSLETDMGDAELEDLVAELDNMRDGK